MTPTTAPCSAKVKAEFDAYLETVKAASEIERLSTERPKTGVFLQRYAINPVNGERLPIWASVYVLADYGHGAIMAVPAHDQRDLDFALAMGLPVVPVLDVRDEDGNEAYVFSADLEDPGRFHVREQWADQASIDAHMASPHLAALMGAMGELGVTGASLTQWDGATGKTLM